MNLLAALRSKAILCSFSLVAACVFFIYTSHHLDVTVDTVPGGVWHPFTSHQDEWQPTTLKTVNSKYAYATFLAHNWNDSKEDVYFLGARLLAYQLLYAPETKSNNAIPFIVMVTKTVAEEKKKQLQKDGAIVVVVEDLVAEWIADRDPINPRFRDVMTKLRLWEMTQFERICLLDGDTVLMENIDGVFGDPAVKTRITEDKPKGYREDEAPLPREYAFASTAEPRMNHDFPPSQEANQYQFGPNYLNSGFIVFQPSIEMFQYYVSLLEKSDGRWGEGLPEQNLLNWAHRRPEGNMPWQTLDKMWNIHFPTVVDMEAGVKSLHEKFWDPVHKDLKPYLEKWKWRMLGYFEGRTPAHF